MKNRTLFFAAWVMGLAACAVFLSGCSYWKAYQAHNAYAQYQTALAAGDMAGARLALLTLVQVDEDIADYWLELGKLQIRTGDYGGAYDSFSHAHELDRTNVEVLSTLAQLALLSGQLDVANEKANSLALIAPDNPTVTLIRGNVALKSGNLEQAAAQADSLLSSAPNDPLARLLKARVLLAGGKPDDAIAVLEEQHRAKPEDGFAIHALNGIYRSRDDWKNVARVQEDARRLNPENIMGLVPVVEAYLRAGEISAAAQRSVPLLSPSADPKLLDATLDLWVTYAPAGAVLPGAAQLASRLPFDRKVSIANYLNSVGNPDAAAALIGGARLPVRHTNARANAVFAQSLALQRRTVEAKRLFDLVLDTEPDQIDALRGRAALGAATGTIKQAIVDAQRLITISPDSGQDRLLLARTYLAANRKNDVRRTLWQAFQDLPEDEKVYSALRSILISTGDLDGERRVRDEFADHRNKKLLSGSV